LNTWLSLAAVAVLGTMVVLAAGLVDTVPITHLLPQRQLQNFLVVGAL
jgi:hypothetical protein